MTQSIPDVSLPAVPMLVGGEWMVSASTRFSELFNPSVGVAIARVPVSERCRVLFEFRELPLRRFDEIARLVTREHGGTRVDANAFVQRGIEVVEFACGLLGFMMGQVLPNSARDVDCETVRHPIGVCVGITPFKFPVMTPISAK